MDTTTTDSLSLTCAAVQAACGCEGVRRTSRAVTRHYEEALAPSGLKATQFPILIALGAVGPAPLTQLAQGLGLDRTTLTRNLKGLIERGLATLVDAGDARVHLVALTEQGREVLHHAVDLWGSVQSDVEERFGHERLQHLLAELAAFKEAVRE